MRVKKIFSILSCLTLLIFLIHPFVSYAHASELQDTEPLEISNGLSDESQENVEINNSYVGDRGITNQNKSDSVKDSELREEFSKNVESNLSVTEKHGIQSPSIIYSSILNDSGLLTAKDGETLGNLDEDQYIETLKLFLENIQGSSSGVSYKVHVQDKGWMDSVSNGEVAGIAGKKIEAIQINLIGDIEETFDIYYRVYTKGFGWLGWAKNGESSGTQGFAKPLQAIEITLVEKGGDAPQSTEKPFLLKPSISYQAHVQDKGWMSTVKGGNLAGTTGQGKRMEAIIINIENTSSFTGGITYSTHVQDIGWMDELQTGQISGTVGKAKQMEAIKIKLTGELGNYFDLYYRVHVANIGWLDWVKNGNPAGTEGLSLQIEAIEIVLVEKGGNAPGATERSYVLKPTIEYQTHVQDIGWMEVKSNGQTGGTTGKNKRMEAISINLKNGIGLSGGLSYSTFVQDSGWQNDVIGGQISGTVGKAKRLEAIKINLTGDISKYFDVYYRTHVQDYGWLGWAKNGMISGAIGKSKKIEAIEIKLVAKGKGPATDASKAAIQSRVIYLDPGHGGTDPGAVYGGVKEKDINLSISKKVKSILQSRGYTVYMTRETDVYVDLYDRASMANAVQADIFVSIHTNSTNSGSNTKTGIESYYYEYDPDYPPKINPVMHNNSVRVQKSKSLANAIQGKMVAYTGEKDGGVIGKAFAVIRETQMPATLLELGYINNTHDRNKLVTDSYQNTLAKAIADGVENYFSSN